MARAFARSVGATFHRIQFTPDLMPSDILGINFFSQKTGEFEFRPGPLMANIVLADEVNRATPKTQSALLEAMQERRVTVGRTTHELAAPYFVLATQNPLEMEGTYPLPEAQLDRFFYKLQVPFPTREDLRGIVDRTTSEHEARVEAVVGRERLVEMQRLVRTVPVADHVKDFAISVLLATHPTESAAPDMVKRFVSTGASPRGVQALLLAAKIQALFDGRYAASIDDIRRAVLPALRHRVLLNFEGEAEGVKSDDVLEAVLKKVPQTKA
jgi:MoxR-like ATPase